MPKLSHNRTWYTKKLVDKAKKCVKLRDNYTCQYSGKEVSGSNCHASHVLNVGTHKNMELDPTNMKVLSSYYHMHWWHKDVLHATEWKIPTATLAGLHADTKADGSDYAEKYYELIKEII
jgi:hypothetical protein